MSNNISVKHIAALVLFAIGGNALWLCLPFWSDNFGMYLLVLFDRSPNSALFLTISSIVALTFVVTLAALVWNNRGSLWAGATKVYGRVERYYVSDGPVSAPSDKVAKKPVIAEESIDAR